MSNAGPAVQFEYTVLCRPGGKDTNEDAAGAWVPDSTHLQHYKGSAFIVADGVSSAEAGQQASQTAVESFINDYQSTPDIWSVSHSAEQLLSTINSRLYRHSHAYSNELKGHLCTFSGLIIKSRTAHIFHVGDSRAYLMREGQLQQLTQDHKAQLSKDRSFLVRALGMDNRLQIDYRSLSLHSDDIFLVCSDGLHDFVNESQITRHLTTPGQTMDQLAETLYQAAMDAGLDDNISILLVKAVTLPEESIDDFSQRLTRLPFPPALDVGMKLDGYEVTKVLFMSSRSHLYLVRDLDSNRLLVMKTPSDNFNDDPQYIESFIREEWVGSRIRNGAVVSVIRPSRGKSFLYYLMEYIEGITLEKKLAQSAPLKPSQALTWLEQIASGLQAFHDSETIHQDLKPGNIMINHEGKIKIVDFGSVFVAGLAEIFTPLVHEVPLGTAEYSDPQYLMGRNSGIQGDVYAFATIAYEMFTGKLPYGEKIGECKTPRDYDRLRYIPARQVNPHVPVWLDRALQKGVQFDLQQRYTTLSKVLTDIRQPNPEFLKTEVKKDTRNSSLLFWQLLSGFWFITLIVVIYLFLISP